MPPADAKRGRRTGTAAGRRNCRLKQEGIRCGVKHPPPAELRQYAEPSGEATARGRRLPRKAAKLQSAGARTGNRHRWSRRGSTGARASHGQGTRQTGPVTSGEGALVREGEAQRNGPGDCLAKTQGYAKPQGEVYGPTPARCRKVKRRSQPFRVKPRIEAPVNGGRNYNGPKVAKFLVGQVPTCTNGATIWALSRP